MSIKAATTVVLSCLCLHLFLTLWQWAISTFDVQHPWLTESVIRLVELVTMLAYNVPLIIFFLVLRSKQG